MKADIISITNEISTETGILPQSSVKKILDLGQNPCVQKIYRFFNKPQLSSQSFLQQKENKSHWK